MIEVTTWLIFAYFIAFNGGYLALNFASIFALKRNKQEKLLNDMPQTVTGLEPGISILVPAYNEEVTIVASIRSMLQLAYSDFEIIVINDGSKDSTLEVLIREFSLLPFPESRRESLTTQPVRSVYRSTRFPNLRIIDKENGGKADSLNAGINAATHSLFCGVDADSILARDSLLRVVQPFLNDATTVATGGTVRIANGCEVTDGFLKKVELPTNIWALFQVSEYLRAFLFGRLGWSKLNAVLIISGAFGLFKTDVVIAVGGYRSDTIGEDMELVIRIQRLLRRQRKIYRIEFLPEPVCWTEVPEDMKTLRNQRIRWQRGLSESLNSNWGLMFSRNGGRPGWLAFPFMVLFEWLSPLIELGGYIFMLYAYAFGLISWEAFNAFLVMAIGMGILLSVSGLLLAEISSNIYPKFRQLALLLLVLVAENFGYRQLTTWWRLLGLYRWVSQRESSWGEMARKGVGQQAQLPKQP